MYEDDFKNNRNARKKYTIDSIKMTLTQDQIMTFVSGLHETQWNMIEELVRRKEAQGFPEAQKVIEWIKQK